MKLIAARAPNRLYASIFLSLIVCILLTVVTLSFTLYSSFEKIALSNLYASEKNSLSQTSYGAKSMIENSTNYALQLYEDPRFDRLLHYPSPGSAEITAALNHLNTYLNVNYFFHSIYLYSKSSKTFYASTPSYVNAVQSFEDFYDGDARKLIENFSSYKRLAPIPRAIPVQTPFQDTKTANVYTFVFYDLLGQSKELDNVIILNVPERWMKEAILSLDKDQTGSTFIIDSAGTLVTSTDTMPFLANLQNKPYVNKVLAASDSQASDYFVDEVEGVKSLVVYSKHEVTNWIFIRVLPYETILGKIETMKNTVLLICFVILLIGLGISFFLSKSLYKPIDKVIVRLNVLMKEKHTHLDKWKQNFLRQLLHHSANMKPHDLEKELQELDLALDPARDYAVILFVIDRFDSISRQYPYKDRLLLKYGVMNIASEWFTRLGRCECIDDDEKSIAILLNGRLQDEHALIDAVHNVQNSVEHYLNLSISASISQIGDRLTEVSDLYKEAHQQLGWKFMVGYRCILHNRLHGSDAPAPFIYPAQLESNMLETLKLGKAAESKRWFGEIVDSVTSSPYVAYNMLFNQLAFSISTISAHMDKSAGRRADYDFGAFINQMHKLETLQEVRMHFCELIDQLCFGFKDKKSAKHDSLIASIDRIIQQNYADRELSLNKIAELLDLSPAYLGRIFKQITNKSLPDYVNEFRIVRAKELLASTPHSIEEISQRTGYNQSTYFYKVFKKYAGITPAEYRQNASE
ncbi:AraC family transcriptional regulator [Paenibacillus methanolicus]|uniref:Cache domain-containing protein n=1 Tax=Paenibacillus methanolicus TaxID=582686 RepID=A0A5S5CBW7_9BACL|nr:AraC family transcriptional regulator [Paenibacillus methanolicus]TYP76854.1 cache domain-containing protein [Paenibacillus methanolicus]